MTSNLQIEIQQSRPFSSPQEELWLNLSRTTAMVSHLVEQRLRRHGLSPTQYNVLRILRGAGNRGLCQHQIAERLVAQVPDVPRIVDRMEKAGWVERTRGVTDRRMVLASLTDDGLELVGKLDRPVGQMIEEIFGGMSDDDAQRLNDLLVVARGAARGE